MRNTVIFSMGLFVMFLFSPLVHANEDPHAVKISKSPFKFKAGEGPLSLPSNTDSEIILHNQKGIELYLTANYENALKHFQAARVIKPSSGIVLYNEAITLDKLDKHKQAIIRFQQAKDHSLGNELILNSPILQAHLN